MKKPRKSRIQGRNFVSGDRIMPDTMLKFVPKSNLKWLNEASQKRWHQIYEA